MSTTSILKNYIKPRIRKSLDNDKILIYNPNTQEKEQIFNALKDMANIFINNSKEYEIKANMSFNLFKTLLGTVTNIPKDEVESLTEEDAVEMYEMGSDVIKEMLEQFKEIIEEISLDYWESAKGQLSDMVKTLDSQEGVNEQLQLLADKLNIPLDQLLELSQKQNELNELKKQLPQPQDHKEPTKKRGRKKKTNKIEETVDSVVEEVK